MLQVVVVLRKVWIVYCITHLNHKGTELLKLKDGKDVPDKCYSQQSRNGWMISQNTIYF